jgi:hypothetical protein
VDVNPLEDQVRPAQSTVILRFDAHVLKDLLRLLQRSRKYFNLRLKLSDTLRQAARIRPSRRIE